MAALGRVRWLAGCLGVMTVIAGCGGGAGSTSQTAASSAAASPSTGTSQAAATSTASAGAKPTLLRVALPAGSFLDLPAWIGEKEGFFQKRGLEVHAAVSSIPFSQLPAALGKTYDLVIGSQPDLINAGSHGLDLVAVSGVNHDNPKTIPGSSVVVSKSSGITSVAGLAGKSVGAPSTTGNNWLTLLCWAKKQGVAPSSIRGLQAAAPEIPTLLKQGRFDAALLFQPLLNEAIKNGGVNLGDSYMGCFGKPMYTSLWLANGPWAQAHHQAIAAFRAGMTEAKQYMLTHVSQTRQVFVARSGLPAAVAASVPIDASVLQFRAVTAADLQPWLELMKQFQGFNQQVDLQKLVVP